MALFFLLTGQGLLLGIAIVVLLTLWVGYEVDKAKLSSWSLFSIACFIAAIAIKYVAG